MLPRIPKLHRFSGLCDNGFPRSTLPWRCLLCVGCHISRTHIWRGLPAMGWTHPRAASSTALPRMRFSLHAIRLLAASARNAETFENPYLKRSEANMGDTNRRSLTTIHSAPLFFNACNPSQTTPGPPAPGFPAALAFIPLLFSIFIPNKEQERKKSATEQHRCKLLNRGPEHDATRRFVDVHSSEYH
jgi:hypothetical protein